MINRRKEFKLNPKITLVGRIGQEPEAIGTGIRFRMATNDRVKNANGDWEDRDTSWFTVKAWKTLAEHSKNNLKKGNEVIVVGVMREENWTDNEGKKRTSFEVVAESIGVTTKTLNKNTSTEPSNWV
ncbi:single-stranded DNA-binding protein [bacterium]|nr:single-stranded DNA-binding protein [Candidatus Elulimicrobium humile]